MTTILKEHSPGDLAYAVELLRAGRLVALPTETVYGLAADAMNAEAVLRVFQAKARPVNHPLIVHVENVHKAQHWVSAWPPAAQRLADCFWPGPLTMLLPKAAWVDEVITGGSSKIAVRIPSHPVFLKILGFFDGLVAPSANPYQRTSPTQSHHVMKGLSGQIDAVVDGGLCAFGLESTLVDLTQELPRVVRPGPITLAELGSCLRSGILNHATPKDRVPGNMRCHYQPQTPVYLISDLQDARLLSYQADNRAIAIVHHSNWSLQGGHRMPSARSAYAHKLYGILHELDEMNMDAIFIERPDPSWADVNDRLSKASSN